MSQALFIQFTFTKRLLLLKYYYINFDSFNYYAIIIKLKYKVKLNIKSYLIN